MNLREEAYGRRSVREFTTLVWSNPSRSKMPHFPVFDRQELSAPRGAIIA